MIPATEWIPPNVFDSPPGEFFVSSDKSLLNIPWIFDQLKRTYWGGWLDVARVSRSIDFSLCFGLYRKEDGRNLQIGFARVVTDFSTFAWLCDVVVASAYRKRGLGTFLIRCVVNHPEVAPRSVLLSTNDAHDLYRRFGFSEITAMKRQGTG
jgi:GNAT superfamily N-acetyltransferase